MGCEAWIFPTRIKLYGLTEANVDLFLSDLDYYRLHPLNNHFAFWVNDKITLKYILNSPIRSIRRPNYYYNNLMPEYYLYIENDGHYSYLQDSPTDIKHNKEYLLNLLIVKKVLAMKTSNGSGGIGFVKLEYRDGCIVWNEKPISKEHSFIYEKSLKGYIVTEYLKQHRAFDRVCDKSTCTLRVIVVKNNSDLHDGGTLDIIASYARFGTEKSKEVCNIQFGGVAVSYNSDTGEYSDKFQTYSDSEDGGFLLREHPDSKVNLKGCLLPRFEEVKDVVLSVCSFLSSLEFFGVDIVVTDECVKILEINTLPAIDSPQILVAPLYTIPAAKSFFERKLMLKREVC